MQVQRTYTEVSYPTDGREPGVELQLAPVKVPNPHQGKMPKTFRLTEEQCEQLISQLRHARRMLAMLRSVETALLAGPVPQGDPHDS